jgi:disease resistance protein RPM1
VVDDVWTIAAWDIIRQIFPENNRYSRIIVTTRIEVVAAACSEAGGAYIYHIQPLKEEDSKKLFLSRFGARTCPSGLEEEMDKILKKCGGLPMAIISMAGLLACYKSSESKDMWERVRKSIGSYMDNHPTLEGMKQIVTISYNHLHYYLKRCIMYLSIFPEDCIIDKERLLRRWIAEGLVAETRGLTLMEVAEGYYNELVNRGMIDLVGIHGFYNGRLEMCRVHDMVL